MLQKSRRTDYTLAELLNLKFKLKFVSLDLSVLFIVCLLRAAAPSLSGAADASPVTASRLSRASAAEPKPAASAALGRARMHERRRSHGRRWKRDGRSGDPRESASACVCGAHALAHLYLCCAVSGNQTDGLETNGRFSRGVATFETKRGAERSIALGRIPFVARTSAGDRLLCEQG